jgi:hypothetical protein
VDYHDNILVVVDYSVNKTIQNMQDKYPMGETFDCWYNVHDPSDIHIGDFSTGIYAWLSVGIIIIILLVAVIIYAIIRKNR